MFVGTENLCLRLKSIIRKTNQSSWFDTNHEAGKLRHVDGVGSTIHAGGDDARSDLMKTQRSDVLICCRWVDAIGELEDVLRPTRPASRRRNLSADLKSKSLICSPSKSTPPMPWSGKGAAWMLARSIKDHKNKKTQTPEESRMAWKKRLVNLRLRHGGSLRPPLKANCGGWRSGSPFNGEDAPSGPQKKP